MKEDLLELANLNKKDLIDLEVIGVHRHGLIMGCSVTGVKPASGDSPLKLGPKVEDVKQPVKPHVFLMRFILGVIASTYFVLVPIYMWIKDQIVPKGQPI